MTFNLTPIGIIHSCFKEKFGIPRQAGLAPSAQATLELLPPYNRLEALAGLEGFSHVWLLFIFHANRQASWKPTVRPPRLGGNQRLGVFATRSTFRPNPIGLSVVRLAGFEQKEGRVLLHLSGVDLLDETPIIDIKPYLPYADTISIAQGGFAETAPTPTMQIEFTPAALARCQAIEATRYPQLRQLLIEILRHDPRPAYYMTNPQKNRFGIKLLDYDVQWQVEGDTIWVTAIKEIDEVDRP